MPSKLKNIFRNKAKEESLPKVTNESLSAHREEVLAGGKKYKLPLSPPKHRIVIISIILATVLTISFFVGSALALYKFQTTSGFMYQVTKVIPFPIARHGSTFISYESYLFELRHNLHFWEKHKGVDFSSEEGEQILRDEQKKALDKVVKDAYVRELAKKHGITVTDEELEQQIELQHKQHRLGDSPEVLENVLQDYWGWTIGDFKNSLRAQLLERKVVNELDKDTNMRANQALSKLKGGADFAKIAKQYSDDLATKDNGGEFGFPIEVSNRDVPAQTVEALYSLKPGEISGVVNTGFSLEILKYLEENSNGRMAAHIVFSFKSIDVFINDLKEEKPFTLYVNP